jgi:UDP-3-O-[3-hydroxymyristoyl] glucosamine N-acyltransferase
MALTAAELATRLGAVLNGDGTVAVERIAPPDRADARSLAFIANPRYLAQAASTHAAILILPEGVETPVSPNVQAVLTCGDPYLAYARVAQWLYPSPEFPPQIHPTAVVEGVVAASAHIGPQVYVAAGAVVEDHVVLEAGVKVGSEATIGAGSWLGANVVVGARCRLGARCRVHPGAVIGADGFGFAWDRTHARWEKIPQVGRVVIGDDVEIGANTTIDRGALEDTVIENGVKIDNLVQIAHNCRVGQSTAIAGCVGLAGSTVVGARCRIGGQAGLAGHLSIGDDVTIGAATLVTSSLPDGGFYAGHLPALPYREWQKNAAWWKRLAEIGKWWQRNKDKR